MKTLFSVLAFIVITTGLYAQVPDKMSYQAVIRNSSNALVASSEVGMKVSILQGSVTGTPVYVELYNPNPKTNINGLVSIMVGDGIALTGTFAAINWANGPYFIKTETDPTGGTNYTVVGVSQLLTVPYAMYAKTAGNGFSGNYNDLTSKPTFDGSETKISAGSNTTVTGSGTKASPYIINSTANGGNGSSHSIGDLFGGGIIVAVWKQAGVEHGLIASLEDLAASTIWSNISTKTPTTSTSQFDGQANTNAITGQAGHVSSAAKLCTSYNAGSFTDWYLPAAWELNLCYNSTVFVNTILGASAGFQFADYWSSTESADVFAWKQNFGTGIQSDMSKNSKFNVRAVRRF